MEFKSTYLVAGSQLLPSRPQAGDVSKGNSMSSTTTRTTRIANHKIDEMLRELVPFTNYNNSIVATKTQWDYRVMHWGTEIVRIALVEGERQNYDSVAWFNGRYYSQTTSALQGRILRNLLTMREVENLLDGYQNSDIETYRRLARMARVR
jgi:hypothetical protein